MISNETGPIVFFDGVCVLCNRFLDVMLQLDRQAKLRVAPLQGQTAQRLLPPLPHQAEDWTIYYLDVTGLYEQSDAVLQILRQLGGGWLLLARLMGLLPRSPRDFLYRQVAKNRYRLLGKRDQCRLPTPAEQERFLP